MPGLLLQPTSDGYELAAGSSTDEQVLRDRATILLLSSVRQLADGVRGSLVYSSLREQRSMTNASIIADAAFTASDVGRRAGFDLLQVVGVDRVEASVELSFTVAQDSNQLNVTVEI